MKGLLSPKPVRLAITSSIVNGMLCVKFNFAHQQSLVPTPWVHWFDIMDTVSSGMYQHLFSFFFTLETRVKPEIEAINIGPLQYICKESLHLIQIMKFQFINIYKAIEIHDILQSDKEIHK